jgi:hypothetical protein
MKQDRFLTGILLGIAVLIIVALAVFFTRKDELVYVDESTPQGVVQNYVVAVQKRDYEKAYTYLADLENKPTYQQFREAFFNYMISPSGAGVEILQTETSDDLATVGVSIIYNQRDPFSGSSRYVDTARLVRQGGQWKIKQMPYSLWAYDWYQPTPAPVK